MKEIILEEFAYLDVEFICEAEEGTYFYFPPIFASFARPRMMFKLPPFGSGEKLYCFVQGLTVYNKNVNTKLGVCLGDHDISAEGIRTLFNETSNGYDFRPSHFGALRFPQTPFYIPNIFTLNQYYLRNEYDSWQRNWICKI